jgi:hypothetical protein
MNEIYQKSKTCQKPAIEISVACQAGQGKPARQGRKNLPLAGLAGQVADPSSAYLFFSVKETAILFLLDIFEYFTAKKFKEKV